MAGRSRGGGAGELGHRRRHRVADLVCIYCGGLVGPAAFAALVAATGGYAAGFAAVAALALGSGAALVLAHGHGRRR